MFLICDNTYTTTKMFGKLYVLNLTFDIEAGSQKGY